MCQPVKIIKNSFWLFILNSLLRFIRCVTSKYWFIVVPIEHFEVLPHMMRATHNYFFVCRKKSKIVFDYFIKQIFSSAKNHVFFKYSVLAEFMFARADTAKQLQKKVQQRLIKNCFCWFFFQPWPHMIKGMAQANWTHTFHNIDGFCGQDMYGHVSKEVIMTQSVSPNLTH